MSAAPEFDVFVSYNTLDHAAVERIGGALKERNLTVFLDRWELVPGRPWPDALEGHLSRCRSAAVVLGPPAWAPGSSASTTWPSTARRGILLSASSQ